MITVYLDHNLIDGFDKGETAYLDPFLANKGVLPIISLASVDEIFRGVTRPDQEGISSP